MMKGIADDAVQLDEEAKSQIEDLNAQKQSLQEIFQMISFFDTLLDEGSICSSELETFLIQGISCYAYNNI